MTKRKKEEKRRRLFCFSRRKQIFGAKYVVLHTIIFRIVRKNFVFLSYFFNFTVKYVVFAVFFVILNKKRVLDFSSITGRNLINTIYFRNYSHKKYLFLTGAQKIFVLLTKISLVDLISKLFVS